MFAQLIIPTLFVAACVLAAYRVGKRQAAARQAEATAARILDDGEWDNLVSHLVLTTPLTPDQVQQWVDFARAWGWPVHVARESIPSMVVARLHPHDIARVMATSAQFGKPIGRFGVGR